MTLILILTALVAAWLGYQIGALRTSRLITRGFESMLADQRWR